MTRISLPTVRFSPYIVPLILDIVALLACAGRGISGRRAVGLLAAGLFVFVGSLGSDSHDVLIFANTAFFSLYASPSYVFGLVVFLALLIALHEQLLGRPRGLVRLGPGDAAADRLLGRQGDDLPGPARRAGAVPGRGPRRRPVASARYRRRWRAARVRPRRGDRAGADRRRVPGQLLADATAASRGACRSIRRARSVRWSWSSTPNRGCRPAAAPACSGWPRKRRRDPRVLRRDAGRNPGGAGRRRASADALNDASYRAADRVARALSAAQSQGQQRVLLHLLRALLPHRSSRPRGSCGYGTAPGLCRWVPPWC